MQEPNESPEMSWSIEVENRYGDRTLLKFKGGTQQLSEFRKVLPEVHTGIALPIFSQPLRIEALPTNQPKSLPASEPDHPYSFPVYEEPILLPPPQTPLLLPPSSPSPPLNQKAGGVISAIARTVLGSTGNPKNNKSSNKTGIVLNLLFWIIVFFMVSASPWRTLLLRLPVASNLITITDGVNPFHPFFKFLAVQLQPEKPQPQPKKKP